MVPCNKRVQDSNLLAGFATDQTNCSDHKPSFNHKMNSCVRSAYSDAKTHLSIQGKNSNSCKKLSRNQNTFQFTSASQKSPTMSGANASIRSFLQSSLESIHHCLNVPITYFIPRFINSFFGGGKESTKLYSKKKPICRSSQAQKEWVKRVLMIYNKPEMYPWCTQKEPNQNKIKLFMY